MATTLLKLASPLSSIHATMGTMVTSEITPRLFLSDWLVAQNWDALHALGCTHVLSIVELSPLLPSNIEHLHVCISDLPICDIADHFDQTTAFIHKALSQEGTKVLVHCLGGLSRSVSVICAYLIACKGMTAHEAIAYTHSCRRVAHPNMGFRMQLSKYATRYGLAEVAAGETVQAHVSTLPGLGLLQRGAVRKLVTDSVHELIEGDGEVVKVAKVKALGPDWEGYATVVTHATVQPDQSVKVDVTVA